jgi:hypothetical protein
VGPIPGFWKIPWSRKWPPTPVFLPGEIEKVLSRNMFFLRCATPSVSLESRKVSPKAPERIKVVVYQFLYG